jgi:hypothetical protein
MAALFNQAGLAALVLQSRRLIESIPTPRQTFSPTTDAIAASESFLKAMMKTHHAARSARPAPWIRLFIWDGGQLMVESLASLKETGKKRRTRSGFLFVQS